MASDSLLAPIVSAWLKKIQLAWDFKQDEFGRDAETCMQFFDGPYDFMYGLRRGNNGNGFTFTGNADDFPRPTFAMTVNKVAEMVQLFGPTLYARNPVRKVNPRTVPEIPAGAFAPFDPNQFGMLFQQLNDINEKQRAVDEARSTMLEQYLNFTPDALNLKDHSRRAIDEALIKGMGVLWTRPFVSPSTGKKFIGSFYDTVDNLVIDPDMETIDEAGWIAKRCVDPVWQVERDFGLMPGTLSGHLESYNQQGNISAEGSVMDYKRKQGKTNDLLVYWKIYSKVGVGGRLSGVAQEMMEPLEGYGDYAYLAVCDKVDYPLNIPPDIQNTADDNEIRKRLEWDTPFWANDSWPFTPIVFHERPRRVWPMSHLKPGLGELKFINWVYSFVASKIRVSCRDFLALKKSLGEEIKSTILHGNDYELLEIDETHGTVGEVVQFLQHPNFNSDIWRVLEAVERNFEKRVGLTELVYGETAASYRSASEAQVKSDQTRIRPDDMANKVEDAMTDVAKKEALASRWHITGRDVVNVLGKPMAFLWDQLVVSSDPSDICHNLEYRIAAGSTRKPNRQREADNMSQAMQNLFPNLWSYASGTGDYTAVNALLQDWAKSLDLDITKYLIQPPPPPPPGSQPPPEQQGGEQQQTQGQEVQQ